MNRPSSTRTPLKNAPVSTPESTPAPARPDLLLIEGSIFWDKYKLPIIAAILLLVLALVASEVYEMNRDKRMQAASAELDSAKTAAGYRHVIETYPGTMAAANAALLLGRQQFDSKDYAGAAATWRSFADKNPQHSLAPVALIGAGSALEQIGQNAAARSLYQRASTSYQNSFAAPLARLDEAALLKAERKPEEARRIYENIMAADANSDAGRQAAQELRFLRVMPSAANDGLLPGAPAPAVTTPAGTTPLGVPPTPAVTPGSMTPAPAASATPAMVAPQQKAAPSGAAAAPATTPASSPR